MKITIDTRTDSKEEIKRVIGFLRSLVDQGSLHDSGELPTGENVFGSVLDSPHQDEVPEEKKDDFSLESLQTY
jgi:hypothetical protein